MRNLIAVFLIGCVAASPANAKKIAPGMPAPGTCEMKENVSVGVSFSMTAGSMMEAKAKVDEKMNQIRDFAGQQNISALEPQSMNYNIYAQNNNNEKTYQVSGNVQYQMQSSDMAFKFADFLEKQKFQVNINSNSYRQGNCNH